MKADCSTRLWWWRKVPLKKRPWVAFWWELVRRSEAWSMCRELSPVPVGVKKYKFAGANGNLEAMAWSFDPKLNWLGFHKESTMAAHNSPLAIQQRKQGLPEYPGVAQTMLAWEQYQNGVINFGGKQNKPKHVELWVPEAGTSWPGGIPKGRTVPQVATNPQNAEESRLQPRARDALVKFAIHVLSSIDKKIVLLVSNPKGGRLALSTISEEVKTELKNFYGDTAATATGSRPMSGREWEWLEFWDIIHDENMRRMPASKKARLDKNQIARAEEINHMIERVFCDLDPDRKGVRDKRRKKEVEMYRKNI